MIDEYVRVLEIAAEAGDAKTADLAVEKLVAHLESAGKTNLLPRIARELRKIAARRVALMPNVEVAHQKDAPAALRAAKSAGIAAEKAAVNKALIGGWRARANGQLIDHSHKQALIDIYQKVIA